MLLERQYNISMMIGLKWKVFQLIFSSIFLIDNVIFIDGNSRNLSKDNIYISE